MMKRLIWIVMLLSTIGWSGSWNSDMDTAYFFAKKRQQVLMVFVESQHCKWCTKMKNTTLNHPKVISKSQILTRLKVNANNVAFLKRLPPVKGVPVVFFMDPNDKQVLETAAGYRDAESFLQSMNNAQKKFAMKHQKARSR